MRYLHTMVRIADIDASLDFYCNKFGMKEVRRTESEAGRYTLIFLGFLLALAAAGIELSNLTVIAGGLGIGIGFGLQNIVNNFVSGLILLFERPVQVGDAVELPNLGGEIRRRHLSVLIHTGHLF